MNIRRMMASGSHLWKRAFATVAALPSAGIETSITAPAAAARVKPDRHAMAKLDWMKNKKRMMFVKLLYIDDRAVKETIDQFKSDYEKQKEQSRSFGKRQFNHVSVTKADLYTWAKRLNKQCKHQHAIEIFEWMEGKKMSFTSDQLAFYVGLIGKVKDWEAALDYLEKVDPNFNQMDHNAKNWPAFKKIMRLKYESIEYSRDGLRLLNHIGPWK